LGLRPIQGTVGHSPIKQGLSHPGQDTNTSKISAGRVNERSKEKPTSGNAEMALELVGWKESESTKGRPRYHNWVLLGSGRKNEKMTEWTEIHGRLDKKGGTRGVPQSCIKKAEVC